MSKINPNKYQMPQGYVPYSSFAQLMIKEGFKFFPKPRYKGCQTSLDFSKTSMSSFQEINISSKLYYDVVAAFNSVFKRDEWGGMILPFCNDEENIKYGVFEDVVYSAFYHTIKGTEFSDIQTINKIDIIRIEDEMDKIVYQIYDDWERFSVQCNTSYSWQCFDSGVFIRELMTAILKSPTVESILWGNVKYKNEAEKLLNKGYLETLAIYGNTNYISGLKLKENISRMDLCPAFAIDKSLMDSISHTKVSKGNFSITPFAKNGIIFYPNNTIDDFCLDTKCSVLFTLFAVDKSHIHGLHCTQNSLSGNIHFHPFSYPLSFEINVIGKIKDRAESNAVAAYFHEINTSLSVTPPRLYKTDYYEQVTDIYEVEKMSHIVCDKEELEHCTGVMYMNQWLLYQIFLYKMIKNEVPNGYEMRQAGIRKGNEVSRSKSRLSPIVIGKDYKPKYKYGESVGTHASPMTHWRSGHWRQQPFGKKEQPEYKTIWIEPTLINA